MSIRIVKSGMLTTVQDEGRWGFQNLGVSVAGPMDRGITSVGQSARGQPSVSGHARGDAHRS